ncbi:MAG: Ubiquinone biosynthesis protein [Pseudomonadota bacterium]|jgi:hypothetical protein
MQNLSLHLQRELRSDHAGETGAVYIYKGIVAVATWRSIIVMSQQHWQGVNLIGFCELGAGPWALVQLLLWCWRVAFEISQGRIKRLQRPSESKCQRHSLRSKALNG